MDKSMVIESVLEYLRQKKYLSDLENDILSTVLKYNERPFDRKGAEQKVVENNAKYKDIFITIRSAPGICIKPFNQLSDVEVMNNLYVQIGELCLKEYMVMGDNLN